MIKRRIKVLQLQPDYNVKAYSFADLAEQIVLSLPAERYEVVSAFLKGRPGAGEPVSRAERSVYFEFSDAQLKGARLRALWRLYRFCRDERFDVVICNRFKPVNMMMWLNRMLRIPRCIGISHNFGEYDRAYRRGQARLLTDARWRFVGVSPAVRRHLIDQGCGFTERNTLAITNAVDVGEAERLQHNRQHARDLLKLPTDRRLVGAVGRLIPLKGHTYLLRAFVDVAASHPDVDLVLVGDGRLRRELETEVARCGLEGRVHFTGVVADAFRYIRAFDIFVMPSLEEGLGLALLEAMAARLPLIGSDIPAMRPLLLGAGGQAVPAADERALSRALLDYLSRSPEQLNALGDLAYEYVIKHHSMDDYRQAYRRLIDGACDE